MESVDYFVTSYTVLGGLAFFFLGLHYLSDSLQSIAGDFIKKLITLVTSNRFLAVGVGLLVTSLVQSSSITTVMVVSLVNARLMELTQAIGVIFGANIGTTITGWILVVKIGKYGLLLLGVGMLPMLFTKHDRTKDFFRVLVGLGLVFFGLEMMSDAFKPLRSDPEFISYLTLFDTKTLSGLLSCIAIGCCLTFVIQSSSAMLGITIALASTGAVEFSTAAGLVLGENIGTTITALLAGLGANYNAKRAALSHVLFNVFGVSIIVLVFKHYITAVEALVPGIADFTALDGSKPYIAAHIAAGHTLFNVSATILALPFLNRLAGLVSFLIPEKNAQGPERLASLSNTAMIAPGISLGIAAKEMNKLSFACTDLFDKTKSYIWGSAHDRALLDAVFALEVETDVMQADLTSYTCRIMEGSLSMEQSSQAYSIIRSSDEWESIADYLRSLCTYRHRMYNQQQEFSEAAWEDLRVFFDRVAEFYHEVQAQTLRDLGPDDLHLAEQARAIKRHADEVRDRHLERMKDGICKPLAALIFSDMIVALRRINNHSLNLLEALHFNLQLELSIAS
jgi:phosphate:Na+ symporter